MPRRRRGRPGTPRRNRTRHPPAQPHHHGSPDLASRPDGLGTQRAATPLTTPAGCAPRRAILPARLAALVPYAVGRDRVLPAGEYLQVSEEIYLACTSGGPRLDPAAAFVVDGPARPGLP